MRRCSAAARDGAWLVCSVRSTVLSLFAAAFVSDGRGDETRSWRPRTLSRSNRSLIRLSGDRLRLRWHINRSIEKDSKWCIETYQRSTYMYYTTISTSRPRRRRSRCPWESSTVASKRRPCAFALPRTLHSRNSSIFECRYNSMRAKERWRYQARLVSSPDAGQRRCRETPLEQETVLHAFGVPALPLDSIRH